MRGTFEFIFQSLASIVYLRLIQSNIYSQRFVPKDSTDKSTSDQALAWRRIVNKPLPELKDHLIQWRMYEPPALDFLTFVDKSSLKMMFTLSNAVGAGEKYNATSNIMDHTDSN